MDFKECGRTHCNCYFVETRSKHQNNNPGKDTPNRSAVGFVEGDTGWPEDGCGTPAATATPPEGI